MLHEARHRDLALGGREYVMLCPLKNAFPLHDPLHYSSHLAQYLYGGKTKLAMNILGDTTRHHEAGVVVTHSHTVYLLVLAVSGESSVWIREHDAVLLVGGFRLRPMASGV